MLQNQIEVPADEANFTPQIHTSSTFLRPWGFPNWHAKMQLLSTEKGIPSKGISLDCQSIRLSFTLIFCFTSSDLYS